MAVNGAAEDLPRVEALGMAKQSQTVRTNDQAAIVEGHGPNSTAHVCVEDAPRIGS